MIRRPPRSTRTDTLFPYTTLFRSQRIDVRLRAFLGDEHLRSPTRMEYSQARRSLNAPTAGTYPRVCACTAAPVIVIGLRLPGVVSDGAAPVLPDRVQPRSAERRVGKGGVRTCKSRWSPRH